MDSTPSPTAVALAFKKALQVCGVTQRALSKKTGISVTALSKFVGGRPPTTLLIKRITAALPEEQAKDLVVAFLADQVAAVGFSPSDFYLMAKEPDLLIIRGDLAKLRGSQPEVGALDAGASQPGVKSSTWSSSDVGGDRDV